MIEDVLDFILCLSVLIIMFGLGYISITLYLKHFVTESKGLYKLARMLIIINIYYSLLIVLATPGVALVNHHHTGLYNLTLSIPQFLLGPGAFLLCVPDILTGSYSHRDHLDYMVFCIRINVILTLILSLILMINTEKLRYLLWIKHFFALMIWVFGNFFGLIYTVYAAYF